MGFTEGLKLLLLSVLHVRAVRWPMLCAAAMNQLTKNLCCEWGPDEIRVNAVSPWYTLTPLAQQVLQDKEYEAKVLSRTPLKRVAQPDEVSGVQVIPRPDHIAEHAKYQCWQFVSYVTLMIILGRPVLHHLPGVMSKCFCQSTEGHSICLLQVW